MGGLKTPTLVWESGLEVFVAGGQSSVFLSAGSRHLLFVNPATSVTRVTVNLNSDTATCVGAAADYVNQIVLEPGEKYTVEDFPVTCFGVAADGVATLYWASTRGRVTGATP